MRCEESVPHQEPQRPQDLSSADKDADGELSTVPHLLCNGLGAELLYEQFPCLMNRLGIPAGRLRRGQCSTILPAMHTRRDRRRFGHFSPLHPEPGGLLPCDT